MRAPAGAADRVDRRRGRAAAPDDHANERYTISHRLHALEARLDPRRFVRLGRGTLAAVDLIQSVSPMPGGTYQVTLGNGQTLPVSRIQSKLLRETLLRL